MQKLIKNLLPAKLLLVLALVNTLCILYLSLTSTQGLPKVQINQADKIFHFSAYFVLSFLWIWYVFKAVKNARFISIKKIVSLLVIIFGIFIEVLQESLTSYRTFDYWDILANSAGVMVAYWVSTYLMRPEKQEKKLNF